MIERILHRISVELLKTDQGQQEAQKYHMLKDHPGWKVHQAFLVAVGNNISLYMLSREFTELTRDEKDAQQRAFYHTKEIIDFLMNPLEGANKAAAFERHNKKQMGATKKGATSKEEQHHG